MKVLYWILLTTVGYEFIIDIISYVFIGKHNLPAITIGIMYLITVIAVYVYDKFSSKDE